MISTSLEAAPSDGDNIEERIPVHKIYSDRLVGNLIGLKDFITYTVHFF